VTRMVRFRTGDGEFAITVENVLEVRCAAGMVPMPSRRPDVVGLLPRVNDTLTVLTLLGSGREHVLVIDAGEAPFGLLVEEVRGIVAVDDRDVEPAPRGQSSELVSGLIRTGDVVVLLVDAHALERRLAT
jgi:chemotaxis signal transduction protein